MFYDTEPLRVCCDYRILTCIAAMEHLYHVCVPVLSKAMVAVNLQHVCLAVVMPLNHLPCVVNVLGILVPDILHDDSRCIGLLLQLDYNLIDIS